MELVCEKNVVLSMGIQSSFNYKVANNAKVMNMLAKGMYSNPIKAPVRELSTNAWDAHVEANNRIPFYVHIPTEDNPTFIIRDYGTGLSQEDMEELYRTYGESSKSNSNLFNGCLGIGSKSPYAYTDSFLSTSYYNGTKYSYINAKLEDGTPTINRVCIEDCDEPNGLEISFRVKTEDIYKFKEAAIEVYPYFPIMPDIINCDVALITKDSVLNGSDWFVREDKKPYAIMGYIAYPIDSRYFSDIYDKIAGLKEEWHYRYHTEQFPYIGLLNSGVNMEFDIGEIDHNGSREGLQYTEKTIRAIKNKLDVIHQEIKGQFQKEIDKKTNFYEAKIYYTKLAKKYSFTSNTDQYSYKGRIFTEIINIDLEEDGLYSCYKYDTHYKNPLKKEWSQQYLYSTNATFFIDDIKNNKHSTTIRAYYQNRPSTDGIQKVYLFRFDDDTQKQKLMDKIGLDESNLVYFSSLPAPKKSPSSKNNYKTIKYLAYGRRGFADEIDLDEQTFNDGGIYCEILRNDIMFKDRKIGIDSFTTYILPLLGIDIYKVVGVRKRFIKRFQKKNNWYNVYDLLNEEVKVFFSDPINQKYYDNLQLIDMCNIPQIIKDISKNIHLVKDKTTNLYDVLDICLQKQNEQLNKKIYQIKSSCIYSNYVPQNSCPPKTKIDDINKKASKILYDYPLLKELNYINNNCVPHIFLYINAVDAM